VLAPCGCKHTLCLKCAEAWAGMPTPEPCQLCGAASAGPFDAKKCGRDVALLLTALSRAPLTSQ
jgi:hypothetical protein